MVRKIIKIDEERCNGCGACATACHEGAIDMVDGKAKLVRDKVTVIGCPKLDQTDYSEKLQEIIKSNNIKSVTVARMIVPCCGGIEYAVRKALQEYGKNIPVNVKTITTDGKIIG